MISQKIFEKIKYTRSDQEIPSEFQKTYHNEVKYRPFIDALVELHDYTGKPLAEIIPLLKPDAVLRKEWEAKQNLNQFYETTSGFIYDCLANHTRPAQLELLGEIAIICQDHSLKSVLDYGGGIGSLAILLKQMGIDASYLDVYGETFKFAEWRFKKRGLSIPMLRDKEEINQLQLDGIICLEVLEHVEDPPALVKKFHDALAPGKILICSAAFHALGHVSHLPENIIYAGEKFFELMDKAGFERVLKYSKLYPQVFIRR